MTDLENIKNSHEKPVSLIIFISLRPLRDDFSFIFLIGHSMTYRRLYYVYESILYEYDDGMLTKEEYIEICKLALERK